MTDEQKNPRAVKRALEFLIAGTLAIFLAVALRIFLFQTFLVPSASMETAIRAYDEIVIFKGAYRVFGIVHSRPNRNDVVVFRAPFVADDLYVKRVIGLPGETVEIEYGVVYINGEALDEPYAAHTGSNYTRITLKENELFVMGDNRRVSEDSRDYGPIREDDIVGRAIAVFAPAKERRWIK